MELTREEFEEQLRLLRAWFPPEDHIERKIKGGSNWWYVKWQKIRERFDDVFGSMWSEEYSDPYYVLDPTGNHEKSLCVVKCVIEIDGRKRQGVGQAPLQIISGTGNDASRGTPVERAVAEAFKNAAESWGVARYLDDQTDENRKVAFLKYLNQCGNSKPMNDYLQETGKLPPRRPRTSPKDDAGIMDAIAPPKPAPKPPATTRPAAPASENKQRFAQLCEWTGKTPKELMSIAEGLNLPAAQLTQQQADQLRNELLIQWGIEQGVFSNTFHARNSFIKIVNEEPSLTDSEIWDRWFIKVGEKKTDLVVAN